MHATDEATVISELEQPWQRDRLVEVHTGKGKPVFGLPFQSAIFKSVRYGSVTVDRLGCQGDEHVYEFHGGPDKALLQYCSRHYDAWVKEVPGSEHLFRVEPGGLRNTCISDIVRIGRDVIAQVSLPRQPCYKLNHRLQEKNMSRFAQEKFRTGWFYRIIQEGSIQAGDEIEFMTRPSPEWTVARDQHYLYIEGENYEMMKELAEIKELGSEIRTIFQNRLNKIFEDQEARLLGDDSMVLDTWADYRLTKKREEMPTVEVLVFEAIQPIEFPERALSGAHVRLKSGGRLIRVYSVVGGNRNRFTVGVALDRDQTRGGSLYLHETISNLKATLSLLANLPRLFLSREKSTTIFLSPEVIGITGLLASAGDLQQRKVPYHLHYVVRSPEEVAFTAYLQTVTNVTIYSKKLGKSFDVSKALQLADSNTHIYCCSGERLMNAVRETADQLGLPEENVHFESFQWTWDREKSLLDALRSAGFDIPSTCEAGKCGTCRVGVRSGRAEHRGTGLLENEKDTSMLSCVSRGVGRIVLDL
ncbi:uncharacterized protein N7477_002131 [Penicillium maclennaniae]|uniref:uncharacterized protein n=1 Tax=Penicillium maclennaniae TaxID=1343394 RepID=UPI002541199A|nr:uncharacterized protein N7477_002131 [Penicillium maclennaniae]KAJ5676498.1 hypothetical protein N7477_002131 [Penicillium maclennaniae]